MPRSDEPARDERDGQSDEAQRAADRGRRSGERAHGDQSAGPHDPHPHAQPGRGLVPEGEGAQRRAEERGDDGADRYRSTLESQRRNADLLLGRVKRELFARIERSDMTAIEARWHTVSDAARTQPTLDIARLMLPMAQEVAAPLGNLLPAVDTQSLGGMEGRARRRLLMCQLMLDGLSACWGRDLAQWDLMEARRGLLDTWLNAVAQQGTDGVRLMAQWNLFASALPLHNARCLPGAAQTLQMVGERLYKLL